jgi:integrase
MSPLEFTKRVYTPSRLNSRESQPELERTVKHFEAWVGRSITVADLTDDLVTSFMRECLSHGETTATVNSKRARILAVWRCAWRKRAVHELPRDVPRCREDHDPPKARTVAELTRLLTYCQFLPGAVASVPSRLWWSALFLAVTDTGERIGALMTAKSSDCDLTGGTLRIKGRRTKTGKGCCYPLRKQTVEALRKIHSPGRRRLWEWPYCPRHLWTVARKIMVAAGLECGPNKAIFHSWRRYCISYTAALGGLEMARRQAGHPSVATTLAHYIDPGIAEQKGAADVLPDIPVLDMDEARRQGIIAPAMRFRGVYVRGKRFEAKLKDGGNLLYLGLYNTAEEAAQAYNWQAVQLFGDAAKLNIIPGIVPSRQEAIPSRAIVRPANPDAYLWHRKPANHVGPCPICEHPQKHPGEHRAVAETERLATWWINRKRTAQGFKFTSVGIGGASRGFRIRNGVMFVRSKSWKKAAVPPTAEVSP